MRNLHDEMYVQKVNNFATALVDGKFPVSGSFIDAGQFDYGAWLIQLGTLNSTITFSAQKATTINGTPATITGKSQAVVDADDNKWLALSWRQDELGDARFVTCDVAGAAGADDFAAITFLGWGARVQPVAQPANFAYNKDPYAA